jgi:hypothetical protein
MVDYSRRLKQILREHECRFDRPGKGDHEIWFSPITKIKFVVHWSGGRCVLRCLMSKISVGSPIKQVGGHILNCE